MDDVKALVGGVGRGLGHNQAASCRSVTLGCTGVSWWWFIAVLLSGPGPGGR